MPDDISKLTNSLFKIEDNTLSFFFSYKIIQKIIQGELEIAITLIRAYKS